MQTITLKKQFIEKNKAHNLNERIKYFKQICYDDVKNVLTLNKTIMLKLKKNTATAKQKLRPTQNTSVTFIRKNLVYKKQHLMLHTSKHSIQSVKIEAMFAQNQVNKTFDTSHIKISNQTLKLKQCLSKINIKTFDASRINIAR